MGRIAGALLAGCLLAGCSEGAASEAGPSSAPSDEASPARGSHLTVTEGLRTEVWRDVQVKVPEAWKLGYAPLTERGGVLLCGVGHQEKTAGPYVGRPGHGSDMCLMQGSEEVALTGEGLWFGSPLPEGRVESKNGLHQTTVDVGTSHVTVASYDDVLRRSVLESIEQVGEDAHGCPARPEPRRIEPDVGYGDAQSLSVCVYERDGSSWQRFWSTSLSATLADQLVDAVEGAEAGRRCTGEVGQLVLLRVTTEDPMGHEPMDESLVRDFVARPSGCVSLQQWGRAGEPWLRLDPEMVRPWAVAGVSSYVWSNGIPQRLDKFFRPLWG